MQVSLIRHWVAEYKNIEPTRDREIATDILPTSLEELKTQAREFVKKIQPLDSVTIWSSPIPRALETSRVFEEVLNYSGKNIRKVAIFNAFEEARGFKFAYLNILVNGWYIEIDWKPIFVPVELTNQNGLSLSEYFRNSEWKNISSEAVDSLGDFWLIISQMESYDSIVNRVIRVFRTLEKRQIGSHHLLIFTHQCCTDFVVEAVNSYEKGGINPGQSVTLQVEESGISIIDTPFGRGNVSNLLALTKDRSKDIVDESTKS